MAELLMLHRPHAASEAGGEVASRSMQVRSRGASYISISVDAGGRIDFDCEISPEYADQMTDVLLLLLIKAREAHL